MALSAEPEAPVGTEGFREGDWICPACQDHQFKRNAVCRKCGEKNPDPPDTSDCKWCQKGECWDHGQIERRSAGYGYGKGVTNAAWGMGGGGGGGWKPGDWTCPNCGDHQFARNEACRKCETPKPEGAGAGGGEGGGGGGGDGGFTGGKGAGKSSGKGCRWCAKGECWSHSGGGGMGKGRFAPY
mmetsp:Transcript_30402/g.45848  ORF Transcript_30402/g.45848 Transcript_30402/m.45848 type:complete len:184 (-) Transcript_30402:151-702(-)|eukprot:CAMPEP_0194747496 /NCGR_PEP_ID=MMETSP0323_2-20130528/1613_1 /TAXON_ID=2866 ORGANISM="Crypthecodinium cohnii, Strain Seligo" /NCGR_SAMPLE_ID=MMETSP0323_2 /ASSEMBLY_ACC=CAM_ASM_000346 /LENGTH=183 /DNA_ID=CAMNT_0039660927 /DNA_START=107 /DNA_END=658 /DNA_ORIENTATION=-